jgi:hypothetical protein
MGRAVSGGAFPSLATEVEAMRTSSIVRARTALWMLYVEPRLAAGSWSDVVGWSELVPRKPGTIAR